MGLIQQMSDNIKRGIRSWLNVLPANPYNYSINEMMDFEGHAIRNRIWYRGDSNELEQFYQQNKEYADRFKFWSCSCTPGMEMRKIHTGLPGLLVRILSAVVLADMGEFEFEDPRQELDWQEISKDNKFVKKMESVLKETLYIGDGAFKATIDTDVSEYPILEWFPGDRVEIVHRRDRVKEIIFKTPYKAKGKAYVLNERYGYGYIINELYLDEKMVDVKLLEATKDLQDVAFDEKTILAVPLMVYESSKYDGRGGSIFDGKLDNFDSFDEIWSQWMDAVRKGRAIRSIPEELIPRSSETGELLRPNPFDNSFIKILGGMSESGDSGIDVTQPAIPHESYLASYVTALDLCLQGIISPSTLGIDTKKLDNAEAQREKEKTTLYTRNAIVEALQETLPEVVSAYINANNILHNRAVEEVKVNVQFGGYANPSFESQVETVGKAKTQGIMSIERCVEELYGDTLDEHCKQEEITRLKAEQGIADVEEPAVNTEGIIQEDSPEMSKLNGAQIASLMNVIKMVKEGSVTRNEAISIVTATLGISRENAESFIEEGARNEGQSKQPNIPDEPEGVPGAAAGGRGTGSSGSLRSGKK